MNKVYRHYIRLDLEGRIIKGFSDAFEQPIDGDICINEQGGRHFGMFGVINPPLTDMQGIYLYKYVDGVEAERTSEEIQRDIDAIACVSEITDSQRISALENALIGLLEF